MATKEKQNISAVLHDYRLWYRCTCSYDCQCIWVAHGTAALKYDKVPITVSIEFSEGIKFHQQQHREVHIATTYLVLTDNNIHQLSCSKEYKFQSPL